MDKKQLAEILNAPIVKRSVMISGHATSVSIEKPFWDILKNSAEKKELSINKIITLIDDARPKTTHSVNLSSAIRLYVLDDLKSR